MNKYALGFMSGLALVAWSTISPQHLRKLADWIEEIDQEREVRIALKAIGLYARQRAAEERREHAEDR